MALFYVVFLLVLTSSFQSFVTCFNVRRSSIPSTQLLEALRKINSLRNRANPTESKPTSTDRTQLWNELSSFSNPVSHKQHLESKILQHSFDNAVPHSSREPTEKELDLLFNEQDDVGVRQSKMKTNFEKQLKHSSLESKNSTEVSHETFNENDAASFNPQVDVTSGNVVENLYGNEFGKDNEVVLSKTEFMALLNAVENLQNKAINQTLVEDEKQLMKDADIDNSKNSGSIQYSSGNNDKDTLPLHAVDQQELENLFKERQEEMPRQKAEILTTDLSVANIDGIPTKNGFSFEKTDVTGPVDEYAYARNKMYSKNRLGYSNDDSAANLRSKRNRSPFYASSELPAFDKSLNFPEMKKLIESYDDTINDLQSRLNQAKLVAYFEDMVNDILTNALSVATISQSNGEVNANELSLLQDAIEVEDILHQIKSDRRNAKEILMGLYEQIAKDDDLSAKNRMKLSDTPAEEEETENAIIPETGGVGNLNEEGEDNGNLLPYWFYGKTKHQSIGTTFEEDLSDYERYGDDEWRSSIGTKLDLPMSPADISSACPAIQYISTNCQFADYFISEEARDLCNLHEICYVCGNTLSVTQKQCDFIYTSATTLLCEKAAICNSEANDFLNIMKLRHRYIPYMQPVCVSQCVARFLGAF